MMPVRRYGALEMLADHLNQQRGYGIPSQPYGVSPEMSLSPEMQAAIAGIFGGGAPQQQRLPPDLPGAVQRSITEQPSWGERDILPNRQQPWNAYSDFEPEFAQQLQNNRMEREQLNYELGMKNQFPSVGMPLAEGNIAVPTDTENRRYSRPYNLGLGNLGALY